MSDKIIDIDNMPDDLKDFLSGETSLKANIVPIFEDGNEDLLMHDDLEGTERPMLPLLDQVLMPGVIVPIAAERDKARNLLRDVKGSNKYIYVFTQRDEDREPMPDNLYEYGVVAKVLKSFDFKDGVTIAILQGVVRCTDFVPSSVEPYMRGTVRIAEESDIDIGSPDFKNIMKSVRRSYASYLKSRVSEDGTGEMLTKIKSDRIFINFVCTNLDHDLDRKCSLLACSSYPERVALLLESIEILRGLEELRREINNKTQEVIGRQQREFFLRHQMDVIQEELGEGGENPMSHGDIEQFRKRLAKAMLPKHVATVFNKELSKLSRLQPMSPDYSLQYSYLETLLDVPWNRSVEEEFSLSEARRIMDRDHYGINNVKERIVEYLAVRHRQFDRGMSAKAQVLCLVGPPGTGKTSVCRSVAEALGRPYRRIALGGLHDEAEIRGHRRTYVGALPGRIVQEIIKAGVNNPVFVLDEIDKVQGGGFHGDPSSALLEVLDPEQNCHFHDNFVDIDIDLSQVLFIATANSLADIHPALLDRMEVIEFNGYVLEEKLEIAQRHLLPKLMKENVIDRRTLKFPVDVVRLVINDYTREGGVRQLEKQLARLVRHRVVLLESGEKATARVSEAETKKVLGLPIHNSERARREPQVGVVTGLAWTPVGGEILFIESSFNPGKGTVSMTGNLGDVMKESATLAHQYIKSNAASLGIDFKLVEDSNVHIHVPEGATPKDGPSAGVTMFVAMVSAFTNRAVRPDVAMTGEATLRGEVTPVGGIKEKILAARRAGITDIILCRDNKRDIEEIEAAYVDGLSFHYISRLDEALPLAFVPSSTKAVSKRGRK
ncbi:MAG: endopeptidase La [Bacteroidales bacterium]|nr:endopeptidase La [Bacteroidales bacterium]